MTRYRWYRLRVPLNFTNFVERLKERSLTTDSRSGFLALSDTSNETTLRFLWRSHVVTTTLDQEGNGVTQAIATVNFHNIKLFNDSALVWLCAIDPPRSSKELMDALEEVAGFGFAATPVVFDESVHKALVERTDECKLIGFKGIGSYEKNGAVARIEVAAKNAIELDECEFLKPLNFRIDHAAYEITYRREKCQVAFSANGLVKIGGRLLPYILATIESTLKPKASSDRL